MPEETPLTAEGSEQPLAPGMVTLSNAPRTRWQNLAVLDVIKARNRAKEAEKMKVEAPFFLPMLPGIEPQFAPAPAEEGKPGVSEDAADGNGGWELGNVWHDDDDDAQASGSEGQGDSSVEGEGQSDIEDDSEQTAPRSKAQKRRRENGGFNMENADTPFTKLLATGHQVGDYTAAMAHLQGMGPSAVDVEIRTLPQAALSVLLDMFQFQLDSRRGFELVEAYLDLTIQIHTAGIAADEDLVLKAQSVGQAHKRGWEQLEDAMQYNMCLLGHFTHMQGS